MNFLRRLFARPAALPVYRDVPANFWTPEDRAAWANLRHSATGQKLGVLLGNQVALTAVRATADTVNTAHSCGYACGVRGVVSMLDDLLPDQTISPASAQSGNPEASSSQDAAGDFESRLAP